MPHTRPRLLSVLQGMIPVVLVGSVVVALDQWTKGLIEQTLPKYTSMVPVSRLGEYLLFEHVGNYGAAFGILQNQGDFFILVAGVVTVVILYYAGFQLPPEQRMIRIFMGLILGGALGNVIDRITQGYVTDFVKIGVPGVYYWPNFNVADAAIVTGTVSLALVILWQDLRHQRQSRERVDASKASDPQAEGAG